MRWFASLFALILMMALFHRLTAAGPLEARATLALGFLLLVALVGGDLAKRYRIPRITGFLLVGFVMGPWLHLVRDDEVGALSFIGDAAAALIAFAAGASLTVADLRAGRALLARVTLGSIVFPFALVAVATLVLAPWFPLTVHQTFPDALATALVLGTIAAASSPVFTLATADESGAAGPFARSVLQVAILKDLLVVAVFGLVLVIGRVVTTAGDVNPAVVLQVPLRLLGSLAAGVGLGWAVTEYLKRVSSNVPLFLAALAFTTTVVARLAAFEGMIVAAAAGFTLVNYAPAEGERLSAALRRGSLSLFAVFFVLAGAGLRLDALTELWPWAVLLVGLRALGLRYGVRWAGRGPGVTSDLARHGWLGLISQAGVALGLAAVANRAFPEWGHSLEALIVAMIGVHELAGPICYRRALLQVGEVTEVGHVRETTVAAPAAGDDRL
jgi:Kef-type K+ transport system membrane component KefB